jgi:mRNA interferase MazF
MLTMQRGDIVLVDLPQAVGTSGHEQTGNRPALVVHSDATSASLSIIMIVPLTSNIAAKKFAHTIEIQPSSQNGLSTPSVLMVFQLRAIDKRRIIKKLGVIEAAALELVDAEMKTMLGI